MKTTLIAVLLMAANAHGQYTQWRHSGTLHVITTPDGADLDRATTVEDFPVLFRLHRDFFRFDQAAIGGADIRFAAGDGTPLAYQIDTWDAEAGTASLWVRVPRIRGNAIQAVRMFWGRDEATSESDGEATFGVDAGFAGVWHLGDDFEDATPNNLNGVNKGTVNAPGIVGDGKRFAPGTFVACGEEVATLPSGNQDRTMSAWINPSSYEAGPTIGGWGKQGAQHLSYLTLSSRGRVLFHGYAADPKGVTQAPFGEWHHAAITITGGNIRFYFDGELEHTERIKKLDTLSPSGCYIGKHTPPGGRWSRHFMGMLDEVRFGSVARSAAWLKLCYENQRPMQRLVGPLVADGDALAVSPTSLSIKESADAVFNASVGGAIKVYWVVRRHGDARVVAVDRTRYVFDAGRAVDDDTATLEVRAVYPDVVKTVPVPITIKEAVPEPQFTLPPPRAWNGRDRVTIRPVVSNHDAMSDASAASLHYAWTVSGPAVIKTIEPDHLVLERSQGSGPLTVTLALDNGGQATTRSTSLTVTEPADDPWVHRTPEPDEKPRDHQFYARDKGGEGTLHCNGQLTSAADTLELEVFADDASYAQEQQKPTASGRYAFTVKLKPGLVRYRIVLTARIGNDKTTLHAAKDLVCGDAYIIQGQSNAEAFDMGRAAHPYKSPWIRSYGAPRGDPEGARLDLWGDAVGFFRDGWRLQIGYWGMELAKQLVARHQVPVFFINGAKGGTRIDQHQRNNADPTDVTTIYGRLLWRVRQARLTHGIRGVLWHQGENDQGSAGPGGTWGWQRYQRYFEDLAASWKRDYPNIQSYHVFQIWPKACSMGHRGSDDLLREVQRQLPSRFSNVSVMSTVGIRPPGGCHYPPEGYAKIANLIYPLIARDHYEQTSEISITPPDLREASWVNEAKTQLSLTFDQPVAWEDTLAPRIHLDGVPDQVETGHVADKVLTLLLKKPSRARTVTYLIGGRWNHKQPVIRGVNGIAALTFCEVPIAEPPLASAGARNQRGDRLLKAGRFNEAIADFDAYIAAAPRAEPYHWQRGIAYYYAGRYADGMRQFELHRKVNSDDVENAVWHFLCKAKRDGVGAAREALLPVGPDGRVPMMTVYELFAGRATPETVEKVATGAPARQTESALFYAHLYLGLYHEALGNEPAARHHMGLAAEVHTSPHYMGDIARMHAAWMRRATRDR
ncbi:MAG: hypothetical protein CMJ90_11515 [Planctomycetes bacterium]|nr:hypothetical protein [Planctomycetota bacterium]